MTRPTTLTLTPIDDKVLKPILAGLYYPDSPYEFSVLPADILGQVYEQFLGKVIRLTPATAPVVEEKPEVKKAGGVYYTPAYIVDYIVARRGPAAGGQDPRQVMGRAARPVAKPRRCASWTRLRLRLLPAGRLPVPARLVPAAGTRPTARSRARHAASSRPSTRGRAATGG
jgi:hypothetical protein